MPSAKVRVVRNTSRFAIDSRTDDTLLDEYDIPRVYLRGVAGESGRPAPYFTLVSAAYHVSGTTGVLHECPHGPVGDEMCQITHEEILDAKLHPMKPCFDTQSNQQ
ncbi:hypothetical protein ACNS7O_16285 (plasmid) [Haloferacaceae archaeon DSL9]